MTRCIRSAALLSLALALLPGCGTNTAFQPARSVAAPMGASSSTRVEAMSLVDSAAKATALIAANKEYKNPVLVSIEGRGLDARGRLVPLLGASWTHKFWVTDKEETFLVNVIHHVEGDLEVEETTETRSEAARVLPLDPAKLAAPTALVPYAIKLGLRVSPKGPSFNHYDLTYNPFYADPSHAEMDTVNVVSYYRAETLDGIRLPATLAPGAAASPKKLTPIELKRDQVLRTQRQHI